MTTKLVYDFDEHCEGGRELLGGKGLGLAQMTSLGLPVPDGFTATTEACREALANGGLLSPALRAEIDRHLAALEIRTGTRLGDPRAPLLVSVRSGGAGLDAGDDGDDPQPRRQRRGDRIGASSQPAFPAR